MAAVGTYVRATIRYHEVHPQLACLVRTENLLDSERLGGSEHPLYRPIIGTLDAELARGRAEGAVP